MRIACAWELGAGLGHLGRIAPWVDALDARGASSVLAIRDLRAAADAKSFANGVVMQAPVLLHGPHNAGFEASSYAELLLNAGYGNPATLATLVLAWRNLLDATGARALIAEHAPTAILAARMMGLPVLHLGDGFTIPPPGALAFGDHAANQSQRYTRAAEWVIESVNHVLESEHQAPIACLDGLLQADIVVLATFRELDHYRPCTRDVGYAGHFEFGPQKAFDWAQVPGPRVLAYLKPTEPGFEGAIDLLGRLPMQTNIYASGLTRTNTSGSGLGLNWSRHPLPAAAAVADCDLVICHGGHGMVCTALLAGKPLLMLPTGHEQLLTARNVEALGAGAWLHPTHDARQIKRALVRCIEDGRMQDAAGAFRARYAKVTSMTTACLPEYADQLLALARRNARV